MKTTDKTDIDQLFSLIGKLVHSTSKDEIQTEILNRLIREHRTNQQLFFKNLVFPLLSHYANTHSSDLRNQATVDFCKSIAYQIESHQGFPYI